MFEKLKKLFNRRPEEDRTPHKAPEKAENDEFLLTAIYDSFKRGYYRIYTDPDVTRYSVIRVEKDPVTGIRNEYVVGEYRTYADAEKAIDYFREEDEDIIPGISEYEAPVFGGLLLQ